MIFAEVVLRQKIICPQEAQYPVTQDSRYCSRGSKMIGLVDKTLIPVDGSAISSMKKTLDITSPFNDVYIME